MSAFPSPVLWALLIAVAVAGVFILVRSRNRLDWGFKDVVKNPEYWDGVTQSQQRVESAVNAAKTWDAGKIASSTKRFVLEVTSSGDASDQARVLRELGERTHPAVLGLLRDASLYGRLVKPTGKDILPEAPFNRACDLLGDFPGAEAVEALTPFLSDPCEEIRKDAALAIAKTGAVTITSLVRRAFLD